MKNTLFHSKSRLQYLLSARHRRGHRVHSPYVFHFLNHVLFEKRNYYCYTALSDIRLRMLRDKRVIELPAIGTAMQSRESRVCDVARGSVKSEKYACLLFRLALFREARTIIELGTSLGSSTLYLSPAVVAVTV